MQWKPWCGRCPHPWTRTSINAQVPVVCCELASHPCPTIHPYIVKQLGAHRPHYSNRYREKKGTKIRRRKTELLFCTKLEFSTGKMLHVGLYKCLVSTQAPYLSLLIYGSELHSSFLHSIIRCCPCLYLITVPRGAQHLMEALLIPSHVWSIHPGA